MKKDKSSPREIYIDPKLGAPIGVRNLKALPPPPGGEKPTPLPNGAPELGGTLTPNYLGVIGDQTGEVIPPGQGGPVGGLSAPTALTVVSQKSRKVAGSGVVIDVTVEVSDVPGATGYEFKVTKL